MKRNKKKLAVLACALVLCASSISAIKFQIGKADDQVIWDDVSIEEQYIVDDTFHIPARTVAVGAFTYEANIKLVYPDGTIRTTESGEIVLASAGRYTLVYEAKDSNLQYHKDELHFTVADKLWRVSNSKSSISYETIGKTPTLSVGLARGDTLTFNKVIDLSTLTAENMLIEGFINPTNVGIYEFDRLAFTFTDVQDATQSLTIMGSRSKSTDDGRYAMSYWTAAGSGQTQGGLNGTSFTSFEKELGLRGTPVQASFCSYGGTWHLNNPDKPEEGSHIELVKVVADETPFKIAFDADEKEVFVNAKKVVDLDNPTYYEKEPLWNGFPSGKVRLTVQALDLAGETANFCISKLFSYDLAVENQFIETEKPEITVDVEEKYIQSSLDSYAFIPQAVVGGSYGVPSATAFDNYSGELPIQTRVYYNYNNPAATIECPIQNGRFSVTRAGKYAIVYRAVDAMGNTAEKVYWITAVAQLANPLSVSLPEDIVTEGVCGQTFVLPTPIISGGSGDATDATIFVQAICGEMVMDVNLGAFVPEKFGEWEIRYTVTDYAGIRKTISYTITVEKGTTPIFVNEPTLLRYLVSGLSYTVPSVYAYDYSSGIKQERLAEMILKDSNGEHTYQAGATYTPIATEEEPFVWLTFTVGGATLTKKVPVCLPLEEKNGRTYVYVDKMFIMDGLTSTRDKSGMTLLATEEVGSWLYANPVTANQASIKIKGITGKSDFDGLKVTFTDYADSNIAVTMYLENGKNGYAKIAFGGTQRELVKGFNLGVDGKGNPLDEFVFSYKGGRFYVDAVGVSVAVDDTGNPFNGFPSNKVYISAELVNAANGSGYILKEFDNHTINNTVTDLSKPRISINGSYGGMYSINDTYVITSAEVSDTIDADIRCYLTVKDAQGNVVSDVNGDRLENVSAAHEYTISLTSYGQYIVAYNATDCFNNTANETSYSINVFDRIAPNVTVANTWSATASVGEQVVLPQVFVTDNASSVEDMTVYRFVRNPNGEVVTLGYDYTVDQAGKLQYMLYKYTFQYAGDYRFVVIACDELGNQTIVEYTITVQ